MTDSNRRAFYRVDYPLAARPTLVTTDGDLEVVDCSESGLRYALAETDTPPEIGSALGGVIRFCVGEEVAVEAVVVRLQGPSVAVQFSAETQVPFGTILREQRHLRRHYLAHLQDRS